MEPLEIPEHKSTEKINFTIKTSTKNRLLAKLFLVISLTALGSYFFVNSSAQQYQKGLEITEEEYLLKFDEYKSELLEAKDYTNVPFSTFIMFIVVSFLIGSYELTALIIGWIIGKIIK